MMLIFSVIVVVLVMLYPAPHKFLETAEYRRCGAICRRCGAILVRYEVRIS